MSKVFKTNTNDSYGLTINFGAGFKFIIHIIILIFGQ